MESFDYGSNIFKVLPEDIRDIVYNWEYKFGKNTFTKEQTDTKIKILHYGITVVEYEINSFQKIHGPCILYYESGEVKEKRDYVNGRCQGMSITYYKDGKILAEDTYHNGFVHGITYDYHKNGTVWTKMNWHHGVKHGREYIYDDSGNIIRTADYNKGKQTSWV